MSKAKLDPLREFLDAVVTRIEALETHCGMSGATAASGGETKHAALEKTPSARHISGDGESPAVKAFDKFVTQSVYKLADTCDDLNDMGEMGKLVVDCFDGMRYVIVLASRSKKPASIADIAPHLKPITDNVTKIRGLRLKREFDNHYKSMMEMLACMSWVTCEAPTQLPAPFVKECIGSSEFWSNRIRKEFKGKDAPYQIAFCDNMKKLLNDLAAYITEHHKTGLTFNPKGVSLAEAAIRLTDDPMADAAAQAAQKEATKTHKRQSAVGANVQGGNLMGMMSELAGRQSADGSSAATGLKKVSKDQQTWRKEFKGGDKPAVVAPKPTPAPVKKPTKKKKGLPILEYQQRGTKWVVENQTKESAMQYGDNGLLSIDVTDPKQQVYVYNCDEVTIKVNGGKLKSLIIDKCEKVNVVFDTVISGCEIVNSKKIGTQVDGVCPVFTIDKTIGVTVWLSEASCAVSSFSTSLSSEMNISIPDGDDRKEMPIPEQFVHTIAGGNLTSEVSDLYH